MSDETRIEVELVLDTAKAVDKPMKDVEQKLGEAGKKGGEKFDKGFSAGLGPITKLVTGIASALAGAFAVGKVVQAASEQEAAINKMNTAMRISGDYSKAASQDFNDFAGQLQASSMYADDVILTNMAMLKSLTGMSNQGLKPATQAALDMSAALGMSLDSSMSLVAKAANGNTDALKRYGISVKEGANDAETFANALSVLNAKFGGSAAGEVNTFAGAYKQFENVIGDLMEEIGNLIIKSPALVEVFKYVSKALMGAMGSIKEFGEQGDVLKPIITGLISFGEALNLFIIAPLEMVYNAVKFVFNSAAAEINGYVALAGQALGAMADLANKVGIDNALTQGLQDFRESSKSVFNDSVADAHESWDKIFDFNVADKSATFLEGLKSTVEQAKVVTDEGGRSMNGSLEISADLPYTWENIFNGMTATMTNFQGKVQDFSKKIGQTLMQGIGSSAANAFAALGTAAAKGGNMLDAFLSSFLQSMGQMAIQLGSMFILEGLAMLWAGLPNGGALIGAGAALAAFGGIMGAIGGGSGGASGSGGGVAVASPGTSPGNPVFTDPAQAATREEPKASVSLTVMGDILDSDETGSRLISLLNSNFDTKGGKLTGEYA